MKLGAFPSVFRVIGLGGATVYLLLFVWFLIVRQPDFFATHGEPILVSVLALVTGTEAFRQARKLP